MNTLKRIVLGLVMIVGLSLAVTAQRTDDQKKPPPKDPKETPKVEPRGEKPPPRPPRDPKKPGSEYSVVWREENRFTA